MCKLKKKDSITVDIVMLYIDMVKIKYGYSRQIVTNIFTQETQE